MMMWDLTQNTNRRKQNEVFILKNIIIFWYKISIRYIFVLLFKNKFG